MNPNPTPNPNQYNGRNKRFSGRIKFPDFRFTMMPIQKSVLKIFFCTIISESTTIRKTRACRNEKNCISTTEIILLYISSIEIFEKLKFREIEIGCVLYMYHVRYCVRCSMRGKIFCRQRTFSAIAGT